MKKIKDFEQSCILKPSEIEKKSLIYSVLYLVTVTTSSVERLDAW